MAIIQGMTPASMPKVTPYQMPIDEMAKGLISRQARADDAKNAILAGESAINVDTRPLQEDWDLLHEIQSDYRKDVQQMIEDANGDYSQLPLNSLQSKAMDYASDDRVRALTAFKVEYDAFNKMEKEINKNKGRRLLFGKFNPLTSSLRDESGKFYNPAEWDLEQRLKWAKAKEDLFFDPVIGKTTINASGSNYEAGDNMFAVWRDWWDKHSNNKKQVEAAFSVAYKTYIGTTEGDQEYRWKLQTYKNEHPEMGEQEIEKIIEKDMYETFKGLMEKRLVTFDDSGDKLHFMNKPQPTPPGGGGGDGGRGGPVIEEEVVLPPPNKTTISGKGLSYNGFSTPLEEAKYIENGGGKLDGDVREYVQEMASGRYFPPSINTANELLLAVDKFNQDGKVTSIGSERYHTGVLQQIDESSDNPAVAPYTGKNNRAIMKIGTKFNVNTEFMEASGLEARMKKYPEETSNMIADMLDKLVKGENVTTGLGMTVTDKGVTLLNGKTYQLEDIIVDDPDALINRSDLDIIGRQLYGEGEWNKKKDKFVQSEGWESSFDVVDAGDMIEIVNNPMIDAAYSYYKGQFALLDGQEDLSPVQKKLLGIYKSKVDKLEKKKASLDRYRSDRADRLSDIKDKYSHLKQRASYLKRIDAQIMNKNGLKDTDFDKYKNGSDFENKGTSGKQVAHKMYDRSNKIALGGANGKALYDQYNKTTGKKRLVLNEGYELLSDFIYNRVDEKEIKEYYDKNTPGGMPTWNYGIHKLKEFATSIGMTGTEFDVMMLDEKSFRLYNKVIHEHVNDYSTRSKWNEENGRYEFKNTNEPVGAARYSKYRKRLDPVLKEAFKNDTEVINYYNDLEATKKDFSYKGLLYVEKRDTEAFDKIWTALKPSILADISDPGKQMYRAFFNRHADKPVLEEMSETEMNNSIIKYLQEGDENKNPTAEEIKNIWLEAYQGLRFDRETSSDTGYVWHFDFSNLGGKKFPEFTNLSVEVPAESGLNNARREQLGITNLKHNYLTQVQKSYQENDGFFFDLKTPGTKGNTTRFHVAWSDIPGTSIKKGNYYMIGSGDPSEEYKASKLVPVVSYDDAITKHTAREYNPQVSKTVRKLKTLKSQLQSITTTNEASRKNISNMFAGNLGLPALPEGQTWDLETVDRMINSTIGRPGGIGQIKENSYVSPDGNITISDVESVKNGTATITGQDGSVIVNKGRLATDRFLSHNEAMAVAVAFNPKIVQGENKVIRPEVKNGIEYTYIDDPDYGETEDYSAYFGTEFPGFTKNKLSKQEYTGDVANFLRDMSLFIKTNNKTEKKREKINDIGMGITKSTGGKLAVDYDGMETLIPSDVNIISSRRSLQENIVAYGSTLSSLTNTKHTLGAGIDIQTNDKSGAVTPNGKKLIDFFSSTEGQALLYKNNMRAMYHTTDPSGKTGWHIHLEACNPMTGWEQRARGSFISQPPGAENFNTIAYDWTTSEISKVTGYTPKQHDFPQYLTDLNL